MASVYIITVVVSISFALNNGDDIDASHINIDDSGNRFIAGTAYGNNYINFEVSNAQVAPGANDTLMILKSVFDGKEAPSSVKDYDWEINWDGWYSLNEVDRYKNIEGTVREGSGVVVGITASGGAYSVSSLDNGGSFYLPGIRILCPGR